MVLLQQWKRDKMSQKAELVITALQQRIAELELDKAILRAEITEMLNKNAKEETAEQDSN
jgi:hypothetical protein